FADAMVGPGIAVRPQGGHGDAVAPITGTVATLHPHAFVVAGEDGRAVLVHLGIDTVKQHGAGFTVHVSKVTRCGRGSRWSTGTLTTSPRRGTRRSCRSSRSTRPRRR